MAINIKLVNANPAGDETCYLLCNKLVHDISRSPATSVLPSKTIIQYDLGMRLHMFTIAGTIDEDDLGTPATKAQLEAATNDWYSYGDLDLFVDATNYYQGQIQKVTFEKNAGAEDRWDFVLTFISKVKGA